MDTSSVHGVATLSESEVLIGLLAHMRMQGKAIVDFDTYDAHRAFYAASQDERFKSLLEEFSFDTRDIAPVSDNLEQALFTIQLCGYMSTLGPSFKRIAIGDSTVPTYEQIIRPRLSEQEDRNLQEFATFIRQTMKAYSQRQ